MRRPSSSGLSGRLVCSRVLLATAGRPSLTQHVARAQPFLAAADCSGGSAPHRTGCFSGTGRSPRSRLRTCPDRPGASHEALLEALLQDVLGQVDADEDHLAALLLARHPLRAEIAAHELVHALEDDLAIGSLHVQDALVAQ